MYKIYVNGTPVFLATPEDAHRMGVGTTGTTYNVPYLGKKKQIKQYIDLLDKVPEVRLVVLHDPDVQRLWRDFQACFEPVAAAGGLVFNPQGQLLVFFRRGSWDLPKGKIDPGESAPQAAVREVQEETGLVNLDLGAPAGTTLHTYTMNKKRMLKTTYWFRMRTADTRLVPQTEEDISEIRWVDPTAWLASGPQLYQSLHDLLTEQLSQ
jgi:8-oxo-dGTP pyrophosphatase MutT (NUDIX family)